MSRPTYLRQFRLPDNAPTTTLAKCRERPDEKILPRPKGFLAWCRLVEQVVELLLRKVVSLCGAWPLLSNKYQNSLDSQSFSYCLNLHSPASKLRTGPIIGLIRRIRQSVFFSPTASCPWKDANHAPAVPE